MARDNQARTIQRMIAALQHSGVPLMKEKGDAMLVWWFGGQTQPLETALGLRRHGGISPERQTALARRDMLLHRLWQSTPEWRDLGPCSASRLMSLSAQRYETTRWPRERDSLSAPSAEPAATWWTILQNGAPIPGSKQLQRILSRDIQDAF